MTTGYRTLHLKQTLKPSTPISGKRAPICGGVSIMVYIGTKELSPKRSQALANHSPDGFNWGYAGSGPAQLALAILLEVTSEKEALLNYRAFMLGWLDPIVEDTFEISVGAIWDWLQTKI